LIDLTTDQYRLGTLSHEAGSVERCYARSLGNCKGPISREHFVSESILSTIGDLNPKGIPWLSHVEAAIPAKALATNCLCTYHNSFLSPLDALAGEFFKNAQNFFEPDAHSIIAWGPSFERWFLKFLIGMLNTGKLTGKGKPILPQSLDDRWVRVLFGLEDFPDRTGLFISYRAGQKMTPYNGLSGATVLSDDQLVGTRLQFAGIDFFFLLLPSDKAFDVKHPDYKYVIHRPKCINRADLDRKIVWAWD